MKRYYLPIHLLTAFCLLLLPLNLAVADESITDEPVTTEDSASTMSPEDYGFTENSQTSEAVILYNTPANKRTPAQKLMLRALQKIDAGDTLGAKQDLTRAGRLDKHYAYPAFQLGLLHYDAQEYAASIISNSDAIKRNPNYTEAYYNRAISYRENGNYEEALADLQKTIKLAPNTALAYEAIGSIYYNMHDYKRMYENDTLAINLLPKDNNKTYLDSLFNRGLASFFLGNYQQSVDDYTEIIKWTPEAGDAHENRGVAYLLMHQNALAKADLEKVVALYSEQYKDDTNANMWLQYVKSLGP